MDDPILNAEIENAVAPYRDLLPPEMIAAAVVGIVADLPNTDLDSEGEEGVARRQSYARMTASLTRVCMDSHSPA